MLLLRGGIRCVEHWIIFLPRLWRDVLTMKWLIFGVWGCCCMISWLELLRLRLRLRVILLPTERSLVWILIFLQGLPLMPRILYEIFFKKILIRECHLSSFPSILGYWDACRRNESRISDTNISYNDQWFGRGNTDDSGRNGIFGEETLRRDYDSIVCSAPTDKQAHRMNVIWCRRMVILCTCTTFQQE